MDTICFVSMVAVMVPPITAGIFGYQYQAAVPALAPVNAFNSLHFPQAFPFRPQFSYAFQTGVPIINNIPVPPVAATSMSRVIYSGPQESTKSTTENFRGFSYQTKYSDGGISEVVFVTGPESKKLMEQNVEYFRTFLLQPNKPRNDSRSESVVAPKSSVPIPTQDRPQSSSVYRFQLYPAHVSPLLAAPLPFNRILSSYHHTFGHSPLLNGNEHQLETAVTENAGDTQESMISEVSTIVAPAAQNEESLVTSDKNSPRTSHVNDSHRTEHESASNNTADETLLPGAPNSTNESTNKSDQESSTESSSPLSQSEASHTSEALQKIEVPSSSTPENSTEDIVIKQTGGENNETMKKSDESTTLASESSTEI